jgi:hypothetical protein
VRAKLAYLKATPQTHEAIAHRRTATAAAQRARSLSDTAGLEVEAAREKLAGLQAASRVEEAVQVRRAAEARAAIARQRSDQSETAVAAAKTELAGLWAQVSKTPSWPRSWANFSLL